MSKAIKTAAGKLILPFCIKAGNFPYNKGGCFSQVDPERIVDQYSYKGAKLIVLRPVIDKLIFEYSLAACGTHKWPIQEQVLKNAKDLIKKQQDFELATNKNVGTKRLSGLFKYYIHNYLLTYKPTGAKVVLQIADPDKGKALIRCELNPARLGTGGMMYFRGFLNKLLNNKHKDLSFEIIAKRPKSIKRIDIAVDFLGVDISDLEGRYIDKDKQLKKKPIQNHSGRTETMYLQMPENDKNEAYWYNKRQAYKDKAKDPVDGGQVSPYGKALYTRYEYRIQETDKPIAHLHSLLNHLPKVSFRAIDYSRVEGKDFTHALFLRYALSRTREKALEMIPDNLRAEYAASYDKAIVNIWKPEKIWEKGWEKELDSLGLLSLEKNKKMVTKKKLHSGAKTSG